jgi:hypothetical protein
MLIKRFRATQVVELVRHEPGLFSQLTQRRLLGPLAGFDCSVNGLPRADVATCGATECEELQALAGAA